MKKWLHESFEVGIVLKGIDGVLEIIGGLVLALASADQLNQLLSILTEHDLLEGSHHITAKASHFGAFYLLSHGIVKLILVVAILKQRLWAYPWMIGFLAIFIVYQVYRLNINFSIGLLALTIFDAAIAILTWYEYQSLKQRLAHEV